MGISKKHFNILIRMQKKEETEAVVYRRLADRIKDPRNKEILYKIAGDEKHHAEIISTLTEAKIGPSRLRIAFYGFLAKVFGMTFALRRMEAGEGVAQRKYEQILADFEVIRAIFHEEERHEEELIDLLSEKRLDYIGSIVLGMNDALVELSGALAGLTIAIDNLKTVVLSGLVTGIAASFSMAASEYLSEKAEGEPHPLRSSVYTGVTYLLTVGLLVLPYLLAMNSPHPEISKWIALSSMLSVVILIIAFFNFYISVVKKTSFARRFFEMLVISLGVAGFSFLIGLLLKTTLGV